MRTILFVLATSLFVMPSHGANHHHNQQVKVVVPFAVPVAVPVSPYSATYYSNQVQPYTNPPKSAEDVLLDRLATLVAAKLEGGTLKAAAVKPTLFATKCAACHAKNKVDGFLSLEALDSPRRLVAIQAIVTEKMPKGGKLTPQEVGQLMLELSTVPEVKAAVEAPLKSEPPPEPMP